MNLAERIIDGGPYVAGDVLPDWMRQPTAVGFNALREELLELRRLRAAGEARKRFEVQASGDYLGEADIELMCTRCAWIAELDTTFTLAELNRRADGHTEVCR